MKLHRQHIPNNRRAISLQWIMGCFFVLFCAIPWVNFGLNGMDSQPWPLLFGLLFLLFLNHKINSRKYLFFLAWLVAFGILIGMFLIQSSFDFSFFRALGNYFGFLIIFSSFMFYLDRYGFPEKILFTMNIVWLVGAGLELIYPGIFISIVDERTTADRGVTSFAPEPTFFAIYLFFNSWMLLIGTDYRPNFKTKVLLLLNVAAIFGVSMSSMGALFLFFAGLVSVSYYFLRFRIKWSTLIKMTAFVMLGFPALNFFVSFLEGSDTRLLKLVNMLIVSNPLDLFFMDASMNSRLSHVVFSIHGFFYNFGLPGGFYSFGEVSNQLTGFYRDYFWYGIGSNKIMSWVGSFLFELGFFGLLFLIVLVAKIYDNTRRRWHEIVLLFILLLSAIPLAFTLIPMLMATLVVTKKSSQQGHLRV